MDQSAAPTIGALGPVERDRAVGCGDPEHAKAAAEVVTMVGARACQADVLTSKGLGDRTDPSGIMQVARAPAADAWGNDLCRFAIGGAVRSLRTAVAAAGGPGSALPVAVTAHASKFSTAVLAGLEPMAIPSLADAGRDIGHGVDLAAPVDVRHVPLIVDAARGAAKPFCGRLPRNLPVDGADIIVGPDEMRTARGARG